MTRRKPSPRADIRRKLMSTRSSRIVEWKEKSFGATVANSRRPTGRQQIEKTLRESEEKYRNLFENARDTIILADTGNGTIVDINAAGCRLLGLPKEKIVGRLHSEFHPPEMTEKFRQVFENRGENQTITSNDIVLRRADGTLIPVDISTSVFKTAGKTIMQGTFRDITERRRMEEKLRESEEKYRAIFEQASDSIVLINTETEALVDFNDRAHENLGYTRQELAKLKVTDIDVIESHEEILQHLKKTCGGGTDVFETKQRTKDGNIRDIQVSVKILNIGGKIFSLVVWHDITERKKMEGASREREKRFSDIAENALEWIWEVDVNGKYTYSSPIVEKILGYKPEEALEKYFYSFFRPEDREELKKAAFKVFAQKQPFNGFINQNIHKNGKTVDLLTSGVPIIDKEGNLLGYRGVDTDITERKQAEESLRDSEEKFSKVFHSSPNAIGIIDLEADRFLEINDSFTRFTGYTREEILAGKASELGLLLNKERFSQITTTLLGKGKIYNQENYIQMKSGEMHAELFSAELINVGGQALLHSGNNRYHRAKDNGGDATAK